VPHGVQSGAIALIAGGGSAGFDTTGSNGDIIFHLLLRDRANLPAHRFEHPSKPRGGLPGARTGCSPAMSGDYKRLFVQDVTGILAAVLAQMHIRRRKGSSCSRAHP
jgi:hypothetical protein